MGIVIGVIVVLAVAALFAVLTCKSKNSDLFKWVGIVFFVAFLLTWVIPYGYYAGPTYQEYGLMRLGFSDIPTIGYYAVYFCLTTVLLLLVIGGFYGVLSKTESYKNLVNRFSKFVECNKLVCAIVTMVLFIGLTSVLRSPFVLVAFVPFVASVFLKAKTDKLTTMGITFGSILVGLLAATYGTDGLYWFNTYVQTNYKTGLDYRLIIGGIALVLYVLYNVYRIKTVKVVESKPKKKGKKSEDDSEEAIDDLFVVESSNKNGRMWPSIVALSILCVLVLLGFFNWNGNLGITCFDDFYIWLTELSIGEEFTIFKFLLGTSSVAFGLMEITSLISFLLIVAVLYGLMEGLSFKDFMKAFGEGFAKMFVPVCLYVATYAVFIVMYMSPYMAGVTNWATGLTEKFNPYIMTVTSFVTNLFHADAGFTGYLVGTPLQLLYADNFELIHTLYITTYGLVQLFMPTGGLLLVGLAYFKIDYKSWFKYIWIFAVAMIVVLLILATFVTYII